MTNKHDGNNRLLHGRYANYIEVGHNAFEFVLDFGQHYPDSDDMKFHTRIIINPTYAMNLLKILQQSIQQYEVTFEDIPILLRNDIQ